MITRVSLRGAKSSKLTRSDGLGFLQELSRKKILNRTLTSSPSHTHQNSQKPYYITTPIFYVNDAPHIGHLYSMVLADILKRWQILNGRNAILCTGTDEHGMKVEKAARRAGEQPKNYCDFMTDRFKALASRANISNDKFARTTDPSHKDAVQHLWTVLKDKNLIYESKHEGWYCVSDETFYPEASIVKRLDPITGELFLASEETQKKVEWTSERNYHFRLSKFREPLLEFYEENPEFVIPAERMCDVIAAVSSGLEDLSISRPAKRSSWGIPVPNDESQIIYVWFDALANYISNASYPWPPREQTIGGWPADLHIIGKDIIRFHCIYWPAFLLAAGIKPPKQILSHAHWTLGKQKMSKSTGNVVNPFYAIDRFGIDTIRYYLAYDGGILNDSDYGNQHVVSRYKKGLQGGIGNLLFRISRPAAWDVRSCVMDIEKNKTIPDSYMETEHQRQILRTLPEEFSLQMDVHDVGKALQCAMDAIHKTNSYFQETKPWNFAKNELSLEDLAVTRSPPKPLAEIIYHCVETLRIVGILLQPFMPGKANELLDFLCVSSKKRSFDFASFGSDYEYGRKEPLNRDQKLFPPLAIED